MKAVALCVSFVVMSLVLAVSRNDSAAQPEPAERDFWVKVIFHWDDKDLVWDGSAAITNGKLLEIDGWGLEERDSLRPAEFAWKIRTGIPKGRRVTFAEPDRGVLLKIRGSSQSEVKLKTEQGQFAVSVGNLTAGKVTNINKLATAELLGSERLVVETNTDDDFSSIAITPDGHRHVLWITYDDDAKRDRLLVRDVDDDRSKPSPIADAKEFAHAHLLVHTDGTLRAVWCSSGTFGDWDIYTAIHSSVGWKGQRLTTAPGTDFQLSADLGSDGTLWLAWQSFRNSNADVFAKRLRNGKWSDDIPVANQAANEWEPHVSVDAAGNAWIGYDSYEHGNYDVHVAKLGEQNGVLGVRQRIAIATSPDFEAHANVLADNANRVWVAYDAAGPNWGKDFRNGPTTFRGKYAEPLHASRRIELRAIVDGKVVQPQQAFPQQLPPDRIPLIDRKPTAKPSRFYEYPQLARDSVGRLWVFFRLCRQGYCAHPPLGLDWSIHATAFTEDGWTEPIQLPRSRGRQNQRVAVAAPAKGSLACAWSEGNRFASVGRKYSVRWGELPEIRSAAGGFTFDDATPPNPTTAEREPEPAFTLRQGEHEYHLYFGDLHRHTNISRCMPTIDGDLIDAHRYALDAVEYDFLAVTDHTRDVDQFSWWRTQKANDWFHVPQIYVPINGYERSNFTPGGGHRNVFFINRGHPVSRSDHWYQGRNVPQQDANPDSTLYPWLKEQGGALTAAHTPGFSKAEKRGTWTYNDPDVEPVAEIFQAMRRSYERPERGLAEEASLWHALKKGHRLGFIASSDHMSTHQSFACVWAKDKSRSSIFEAIQARRTFAATGRIAIDFRIGDALMGQEIRLTDHDAKSITLKIRVAGTDRLSEIQVVRSGKVIHRMSPGNREINTTFEDKQPLPGESYYYIRILQINNETAWASPIWVHR